MYSTIKETLSQVSNFENLSQERKAVLQPLIRFIQNKRNANLPVLLHFICTHNSRRSHLAQVWAQAAAHYFDIHQVYAYSGGTETTALYPQIIETLKSQGFAIQSISTGANPIYAIKFSENSSPIIGFSKVYSDFFNPSSNFAALMTCSQADIDCPNVSGAEIKIAVPFEDPKVSDTTPTQAQVYTERSLEIATEMLYVFSKII